MKTATASVAAAFVASACCIGPVLLVLLGIGTFGASLAALERYRPAFLAITGGLLAWAFYSAYRTDCGDCSVAARRRTKLTVWIAAGLVGVIAAFPYYVGFLF